MARWGMPGPPQFGGAPITNIRNVGIPHWRRWLAPGSRPTVPATSFCEYADTLARIINDVQARGAKDERRFDELRAIRRPPRRVRRS